jgi:hypothetical protein
MQIARKITPISCQYDDSKCTYQHLLHGLDGSYNALVMTVNGNHGTTLDDFYGQLRSYDMLIALILYAFYARFSTQYELVSMVFGFELTLLL